MWAASPETACPPDSVPRTPPAYSRCIVRAGPAFPRQRRTRRGAEVGAVAGLEEGSGVLCPSAGLPVCGPGPGPQGHGTGRCRCTGRCNPFCRVVREAGSARGAFGALQPTGRATRRAPIGFPSGPSSPRRRRGATSEGSSGGRDPAAGGLVGEQSSVLMDGRGGSSLGSGQVVHLSLPLPNGAVMTTMRELEASGMLRWAAGVPLSRGDLRRRRNAPSLHREGGEAREAPHYAGPQTGWGGAQSRRQTFASR